MSSLYLLGYGILIICGTEISDSGHMGILLFSPFLYVSLNTKRSTLVDFYLGDLFL